MWTEFHLFESITFILAKVFSLFNWHYDDKRPTTLQDKEEQSILDHQTWYGWETKNEEKRGC